MAKKKSASKTIPSEAIRQRQAKRDPLICCPAELSKLPGLGALITDCEIASKLVFSYCAWLFNDEPFGFKRADVGDGEYKRLWGIYFSEIEELRNFVSRIINQHSEAPTPAACRDIVNTLNAILAASGDEYDGLARQLYHHREALKGGIAEKENEQRKRYRAAVAKRPQDGGSHTPEVANAEPPAKPHQQKADGHETFKSGFPPIAEDAKLDTGDSPDGGEEEQADDEPPAITTDELVVLKYLGANPQLLKSVDKVVQGAKRSNKTVCKCINSLISKKLAHRPDKQRSGATITSRGKVFLTDLNRP